MKISGSPVLRRVDRDRDWLDRNRAWQRQVLIWQKQGLIGQGLLGQGLIGQGQGLTGQGLIEQRKGLIGQGQGLTGQGRGLIDIWKSALVLCLGESTIYTYVEWHWRLNEVGVHIVLALVIRYVTPCMLGGAIWNTLYAGRRLYTHTFFGNILYAYVTIW